MSGDIAKRSAIFTGLIQTNAQSLDIHDDVSKEANVPILAYVVNYNSRPACIPLFFLLAASTRSIR